MTETGKIEQLAEDFYLIEVPRWGQWNNVFLLGPEPVTLVDAGGDDGTAVLAALQQLGISNVETILLSHTHEDHAAAADPIREATGAKIYLDPRDQDGHSYPVEQDGFIHSGDRINAGRFVLDAIDTAGHAPGHLSFHAKSQRFLLAGDLLSGNGTIAVSHPRGSMQTYLDSLYRAQQLEFDVVYPGHGPTIVNGKERIQEYIDLRLRREGEIRAYIEGGVTNVPDLVNLLYPDIDPRYRRSAIGTVTSQIVRLVANDQVEVTREGDEMATSEFRVTG